MKRFASEPHPLLRPFVHEYWGLVREPRPARFEVTPDRYLEVLFFAGPPCAWEPDVRERLAPCTLVPLLDRPLTLELDGMTGCAAIRLNAWSAGMLVPNAGAAIDRWCDLGAVFGTLTPIVLDALQRGRWESVTGAFDRALLARFAAPPSAAQTAIVHDVVNGQAVHGTTTTADVGRRHGVSRRSVERTVRSLTSHSPKELGALARFQMVRDALWAQPQRSLADLASEAGYADQAHLTREFRRYAGRSPGQFKRECAAAVAFLQAERSSQRLS